MRELTARLEATRRDTAPRKATPRAWPPRPHSPTAGNVGFLMTCGCLLGLLTTTACGRSAPANDSADLSQAIYAAPGGWSGGDGSRERPYDLKTALSGTTPIRPGGTVWLRGGTYRVAGITSVLTGSENAAITVRALPGEQAVIDGAQSVGSTLTLNGAWTVYRDFEMTNSDPRRSGPELNRAAAIDVHGPNVKLVNLVVHDLGSGFGMWSDAIDAEAYGNIIYYNGWVGPDRAHGHGIYTQNKSGVRRIADNIIFGQFGIGIHAYASDEGFLDDIQLEGNVVVNNGITAGDFNILLGGHRIAKRPVLKANYTYDHPGAGNNVGYDAGCEDLVMKDNYFSVSSGGYSAQLVNCAGVLEGNVLIGGARGITGKTIVTQSELASQYPGNDFVSELPGEVKTFVRPNRYARGRAHVIVYNWGHAKQVRVDLAPAAIPVGASFEIRDVRNLAAGPVASGTYIGTPVSVPMEGLTAAPIIGWKPTPPHTAPAFAVFLLTSSAETPSTLSSLVARMRGVVGF
jgi:hypothetical protein